MEPAVLIGGAFDGSSLGPFSHRGDFIYVGGSASKPKSFVRPGTRRQLYRLERAEGRIERYLLAEHTHRLCGCGTMNELAGAENCRLCGTQLLSRT